ncbi:hypothetical protein [Paenarthrobacter nitroguajacolicus]|uniref:hypothetical protein n=1 Tax=Paenarthrobacter nitroguajacolicus TaxID=211146 RepID=UPI00248D1CE9|nr:hypothetical protein [Paenarthrobacter nitroguajacolicus]MDI2034722.1 hypothetical protein [Paenarthrobacter nitroguajacolicus]
MSHAQQVTEQAPPPRTVHGSAARDAAVALLIGVLAAALGLTPWWVTGATLPLQNLWANQVMPDQMPFSLLPLSQYEGITLIALLTTGGAIAGLAIRLWNPVHRGIAKWCAVGGVLFVQIAATVQSFMVLSNGLAGGKLAALYFFGMLGGVVLSIIASMVAALLISAKSRATTALGVGLVAVPAASWAVQWAVGLAGRSNMPIEVSTIAHWVPAVLVGCALAWCGLKPTRRVVVWVLNLVFLWVVPAVFTAVQSVLGTRVIAGDIPEMMLMGRQVLTAALGPDGGAGPTVLLALGVGLVGVAIRTIGARKASTQP